MIVKTALGLTVEVVIVADVVVEVVGGVVVGVVDVEDGDEDCMAEVDVDEEER